MEATFLMSFTQTIASVNIHLRLKSNDKLLLTIKLF